MLVVTILCLIFSAAQAQTSPPVAAFIGITQPPCGPNPWWNPWWNPLPPCNAPTNRDMQSAIQSTASLTWTLASSGRDASSVYLLRSISNALYSLWNLQYDQATLVMLSPAINQMRSETQTASTYCRQTPLPVDSQNNLSRNLVFWTNGGRNPTPQQVQNLFNTAAQFLQQYC